MPLQGLGVLDMYKEKRRFLGEISRSWIGYTLLSYDMKGISWIGNWKSIGVRSLTTISDSLKSYKYLPCGILLVSGSVPMQKPRSSSVGPGRKLRSFCRGMDLPPAAALWGVSTKLSA